MSKNISGMECGCMLVIEYGKAPYIIRHANCKKAHGTPEKKN